ncbi:multiple coagulation factor deficiency protein 2 homolog [Branchiostoma lanceolatum]|uniref:multiple coagulation factor deficiency protein 2 homolog n=1 Tax=Branchiostoma lanceolatum TaxID=7740 RepID=UPI003455AAD9
MEFLRRLLVVISAFLFLVPIALCTGTGDTASNRFRDPAMTQDKHHLKEHVQELTEEQINQMSPEEMEFHFFKSHDGDKDLKLDGLEIMAAIEHSTDYGLPPDYNEMMEYLMGLVDKILEDDDSDDDGMISWIEYVIARKRREVMAEAARKQKEAEMKQQGN